VSWAKYTATVVTGGANPTGTFTITTSATFVRVRRVKVQRTAGVAAATFAPALFEDAARSASRAVWVAGDSYSVQYW
jgi:hypothetical protein